MNKYHNILNELYEAVDKIDNYQQEAKRVIELIGSGTVTNNEQLELQSQKLEELKDKITNYIDGYNAMFNEITINVSKEFEESIKKNVSVVKKELVSETSQILESINETFMEVYGNLNKDRLELIEKLKETLTLQEKETNIVKDMNTQIEEQNKYLKTINKESKDNIEVHFESIRSIKEELELLKENFDLKYVYNKKRILLTSIFSFIMLIMITATVISSIFMFSYYFKLIFFPNRLYTLFIGILTTILGIGLVALLVIVLIKPPTFIKTRKVTKGEKSEK